MYLLCWTLYAFCIGPGRVHGDGVRACTHPVRTVVPCRRQPEKVHAHKRLEGVASGRKSSYWTLHVGVSAHDKHLRHHRR